MQEEDWFLFLAHCSLSPPKGTASQAPAEDQTTTRTSYLPLFSERVNLCKPKVNSIKCETHILPSTEQRKTFRYKETLSHSQVSNVTGRVAKRPAPWETWPRLQPGPMISLLFSQVSPAAHEPVPDIFMPKTGLNTEKRRKREKLEERNYPNNLHRNAQFRTHMS